MYESTAEDRNITDDLMTEMPKENVKILVAVVVGKKQFETPQQMDQTSCGLFILTKVLSKQRKNADDKMIN